MSCPQGPLSPPPVSPRPLWHRPVPQVLLSPTPRQSPAPSKLPGLLSLDSPGPPREVASGLRSHEGPGGRKAPGAGLCAPARVSSTSVTPGHSFRSDIGLMVSLMGTVGRDPEGLAWPVPWGDWGGSEREEGTPSTSPSGAGEASHKGCLPGPLRPQMTVCLLPSLEVTHPPAGTMVTGVNKAILVDVANSCWLHGRARRPALPQPCLGVHAPSRPTSHWPLALPGPTAPHREAPTPLADGRECRAFLPLPPAAAGSHSPQSLAPGPRQGPAVPLTPHRGNGRGKVDHLVPQRAWGSHQSR